eukprot:gene23475-31826_t
MLTVHRNVAKEAVRGWIDSILSALPSVSDLTMQMQPCLLAAIISADGITDAFVLD